MVRSGRCFLVGEDLALELVGELGGDHLEQVHPQLRQLPWRRSRRPSRPGASRPVARCSAVTAKSPVVGSRSRDLTITRAWSALTAPWPSRRRDQRAVLDLAGEVEVGAGVTADLAGLDRDPVGDGAGGGVVGVTGPVGLGEDPEPQGGELGLGPGSGEVRASRCSSGLIDHTGAWAMRSRRSRSRWANSCTGWRRSTGWLLITQSKHRALTGKGLCRAGADDADPLAGEIDAFLGPAMGVAGQALECIDAGNVRHRRRRENADRGNQKTRRIALAALQHRSPSCASLRGNARRRRGC